MGKNLRLPARDRNTISVERTTTEFIYSDYSWGKFVRKSRLPPGALLSKSTSSTPAP
jgi:hypothetical protein